MAVQGNLTLRVMSHCIAAKVEPCSPVLSDDPVFGLPDLSVFALLLCQHNGLLQMNDRAV